MTKFTEKLWRDVVREHGPELAHAELPEPGRAPLLRRPRVLAGSTLAMAGAGTALALTLTATGSTSAFAVTTSANGSVLVTMTGQENIIQANNKLIAMGLHEQFLIDIVTGPAPVRGPVDCQRDPGVSGPPLKVLLGQDGTQVIKSGAAGNNTGEGTWHLANCTVTRVESPGNTGAG
jgi:hypothetical protein